MIKVAHVITRLIVGGAQENTILTCEELHKDARYKVVLISGPAIGPEGELETRARMGGYRFILLNELRRSISLYYDFIAFSKLILIFLKEKPKVVHTHSSKAGILARLAAKLTGCPVIIHTIHGLPFHPYQNIFVNWFYRALEILAGQFTDKIICVAEAMKQKAIKVRIAQKGKFRVIYSGLEVEKLRNKPKHRKELRAKYDIPADAIVLGKISRLASLKGHKYLFNAFKKLSERKANLYLVLVGDGLLKEELRGLAARLGVASRILFKGLMYPDRIPEIINTMDLVVHTSFHEGLPRACVQALLCRKPVVAFDIDGAREVVIDNETGLLVRKIDSDSLAEAIDKIISNPRLAKDLGKNGDMRFRSIFDHINMVESIKKVYEEFLVKR